MPICLPVEGEVAGMQRLAELVRIHRFMRFARMRRACDRAAGEDNRCAIIVMAYGESFLQPVEQGILADTGRADHVEQSAG